MRLRLFVSILLPTFLCGCCSDRLETQLAIQKADQFLKAIDQNKYDLAEKFYTYNFQRSEPADARALKFDMLKKITGRFTEIVLLDSLNEQPRGEESRVTLTFLVKGEKANTRHTLVFVKDEGDLRIGFHSITNQ